MRHIVLRTFIVAAFCFSADAAFAEPTPPAGSPASPPPASVLEPTPTVSVHIESPDPVELEVQHDNEWTSVCTSPCDREISTKDNYRINGSGVRASKPFRIQSPGTVKLDVDPASSSGHVIGIVLVVTGAVGLVPALGVTGALAAGLLFGLILICPIVAAFSDRTDAYGGCLVDIGGAIGNLYASPYV